MHALVSDITTPTDGEENVSNCSSGPNFIPIESLEGHLRRTQPGSSESSPASFQLWETRAGCQDPRAGRSLFGVSEVAWSWVRRFLHTKECGFGSNPNS